MPIPAPRRKTPRRGFFVRGGVLGTGRSPRARGRTGAAGGPSEGRIVFVGIFETVGRLSDPVVPQHVAFRHPHEVLADPRQKGRLPAWVAPVVDDVLEFEALSLSGSSSSELYVLPEDTFGRPNRPITDGPSDGLPEGRGAG